ncbi:TIGR03089 family protein [Frankia sp. QA3]|uniref:TIGR03089 family protein n=1 Tax=Frankia sp. QA3 TaxID=710111 RepID=UPI000269C66C|nr:TIGR03089 family protein [Frankia sp. QA3]EIV93999.1 TIGR03089 family protein [Frankia sp. QA3]
MTGAPRLVPAARLLGPAGTAGPPDGDVPAGVRGIASLLAHRLATDPARPLVTFYDDATGERLEFSATTLDNWVAKTANMLVDTLGLGAGDRIGVDLPTHWLGLVIPLAGWSAGLEVVLAAARESDGAGAQAAGSTLPPTTRLGALFVAEDRLDATAHLVVDETVALSLRPLGGRMLRPVPGVLDYSAEVPAHGDRFAPPPPPPEQAELLRAGARTAAAWGLGPADRVLSTAPVATTEGLLGGLLAPLVAGSSIVLCRRLDPAALTRRIATERVTAIAAAAPAPAGGPGGAGPGDAAVPDQITLAGPGVRALRLPLLG